MSHPFNARNDDAQAAGPNESVILTPRGVEISQQAGLPSTAKAVLARADLLFRTIDLALVHMLAEADHETILRVGGMIDRSVAGLLGRSVRHDGWRRDELMLGVEAAAAQEDHEQGVEWLVKYCSVLYPSQVFSRELLEETLMSFRRGPGHPRTQCAKVRPKKECLADLFGAAGLELVEPDSVDRMRAVRTRIYGG